MRYVSSDKILGASWYSLNESELFSDRLFFSRMRYPSIVLPEDSPDGSYHMFTSSFFFLNHYTSTTALEWKKKDFFSPYTHSPQLYREGGVYYMLSESHDRQMESRKTKDVTKRGSKIYLSQSSDLDKWTEESVVLDAKKISQASFRQRPSRIYGAHIVPWNGRYRIYFGAGDVCLFDSKVKVSSVLMYAESQFIEGPYKVNAQPVLSIAPDSAYMSLAVGHCFVYPCSDALVLIASSQYFDKKEKRSRSALLLFISRDGNEFSFVRPLFFLPDTPWANVALTSSCLIYVAEDDSFYLYYTASGRRKRMLPKTECMGLLIGRCL